MQVKNREKSYYSFNARYKKNCHSLIFWAGVSWFSVTLFYSTLFSCGGKANLVQFTLFYSTLLTITDRQKYRQRNEYTRFAWVGGTFFLLRPEKKILVICPAGAWSLLQPEKKIQSSVWRVRDHYYDRKKKVLVVCLAGALSLLQPEKKVLVVIPH